VRDRRALERHDREVMDAHVAAFRPDAVAFFAMGGLPMSLVHPQTAARGWRRARRLAALRATRGSVAPAHAPPAPARVGDVAVRQRVHARPRSGQPVAAGGDRCRFPPGSARAFRRPRPAPPWSWSLLFVGRLDPRKGADVALAALEHLPPQATLTIAGPGEADSGARVARAGTGATSPTSHTSTRLPTSSCSPRAGRSPGGFVPLEAMGLGRR